MESISNEMQGASAVWLQIRSSVLRTISTFIQDSSKQPKKYLANELRENSAQYVTFGIRIITVNLLRISRLLLESRGAGKNCQARFKFLQKVLQSMAVVYEHGEVLKLTIENLYSIMFPIINKRAPGVEIRE